MNQSHQLNTSCKTYGCTRSDSNQTIKIKELYPSVEKVTISLNDIKPYLNSKDTIVFNEIEDLGGTAEAAIRTYIELYRNDIRLIFIEDSAINSENYDALKTRVSFIKSDETDSLIRFVEKFMEIQITQYIQSQFDQHI